MPGPPRTGSVIVTVFGDAIAPRGGEIALPALLTLMRRLGAPDGVVRTALSRLHADMWLDRTRVGRNSFYRLGIRGLAESEAAAPRIYGPLSAPWGGQLRLVFSDGVEERGTLSRAGYAPVAPGVYAAPDSAVPEGSLQLVASGDPEAVRALASRAWPVTALAASYSQFVDNVPTDVDPEPLGATAARIMLIHEYRRIALRDPHLPAALLPHRWPGHAARRLCATRYAALAPASERWLDTVHNGSGPLPKGPDPRFRFSGGDR